jgi:tetratricopeptide (TPR) repeat protein
VLVLHHIRADGAVRDTPLGSFAVPLLRHSEDIARYAKLRDRVVSRVVTTVLPALELRPGGALTPRDSESYRLYLLARERLASGGCDGEAAVELLRRSLEIDDRFAPAWNAYAWALYHLSSACTEGSRHHALALDAADRALALAPSMASALTLKARVMAETGRVDEAYALIRDALRKDPANIDLHHAHFVLLAQTGFLDLARTHLQRVVAADPNHLAEHGLTPTPYLYAGDLERFLESLPESDAPPVRYARGFAELMRGRPDLAHRTLEPSFRSNPADAHARLSHALLAVIEGRHDEARAIVRHFARQRDAVGDTDPEMTYRLAQVAALAGDDALAIRQLDLAVRQGFFCAPLIGRDPALVSISTTKEYAALVHRAERRQDVFATRFGLPRAAGPGPSARHSVSVLRR